MGAFKEWLRERGVPVRRSRVEAQAAAMWAASPMRIAKERGYDSDVVMSADGIYYYWRRYHDGRGTWVAPFPGTSEALLKHAAERRRERGLTLEFDADGWQREVPLTPEQLSDPQRYRGCIRVEPQTGTEERR